MTADKIDFAAATNAQRDAAWDRRSTTRKAGPKASQFRVVKMSDVQEERVEWLWHGRIPRGMLCVLDGDPGIGKSTLTLEIAARISRGDALPFEPLLSPRRDPAGVLIVSSEDVLSVTVKPRLRVAGADLERVEAYAIEGGMPNLDENLDDIEAQAKRIGAGLIIIDPLMALLGQRADAHKDQDVRRVLGPVASMAARVGAAVLAVRHLNKSNVGVALYRGGGSIGIIGAARVGMMLARDPADADARVLAVTKGNLTRPIPSLRYRLDTEGDVARVRWEGECNLSADDSACASKSTDPTERRAVDQACDVLREILAGGPMNTTEVEAEAKAAGISKSTLRRAATEVGVRRRKAGRGPWRMELVGGEDAP